MGGEQDVSLRISKLLQERADSGHNRGKLFHPMRSRVMDEVSEKSHDLGRQPREVTTLIRAVIHFDQSLVHDGFDIRGYDLRRLDRSNQRACIDPVKADIREFLGGRVRLCNADFV